MAYLKDIICMPLQDVAIVVKIAGTAITSCAVIIGGFWTYRRFIRQRENHALIDFTTDIIFHKRIKDWWVVEIIAYVENKGKVQHTFNNFAFELSSIDNTDPVKTSVQFRGQVDFPNLIAKGLYLPDGREFFVEPGLRNKYSYVTRVSANAAAVILHSSFNYPDRVRLHVAEKTMAVPHE